MGRKGPSSRQHQPKDASATQQGTVMRSTGSWYRVRTEAGVIDCRMKGNLRIKGIKTTNPVAVGDHVTVSISPPDNVISAVLERRNYVLRKSVNLSRRAHILCANIDQAIIVFTLDHPVTTLGYVDRLLVTCEAYHIPALIVFNKVDLLEGELLERLEDYESIYQSLGYETVRLNAKDVSQAALIQGLLKDKVSFLVGRSGSGKSSIVNLAEPGLHLKVGEVSNFSGRGIHTTTFAEMFPLSFGGDIIDSPGFKEMVIFDFEKPELSGYFPEMRPYLNACRFGNCLHDQEPGCAVKAAVEQGLLPESRYHTYLGMLSEVEDPGW